VSGQSSDSGIPRSDVDRPARTDGGDAGDDGAIPEDCNLLDHELSPILQETPVLGQPPTPTGGTPPPGLYYVTRLERYVGDGGPVSQRGRGRMYQIGDASLTYATEDFDVDAGTEPPDHHRNGNFAIQGTNLVVTETCPVTGNVDTWPFSVLDGGVQIYREPTLIETLTPR
jgi:hypothetical protein